MRFFFSQFGDVANILVGSDAKNQRLHRRNAGSLIDIEVSEAKDSICNALTSGRTIGGGFRLSI